MHEAYVRPLPPVRAWVYHRRTMANKPARRPLGRSRRAELNVIDYTLAKRAILRDSQMGLQSVNDLCDAHPELMRAAKYVGEPTRVDCPVCGKCKLVLLAYVYGEALKHDNGRVWSIDTGLRMAAANQGACCYRRAPKTRNGRGLSNAPRRGDGAPHPGRLLLGGRVLPRLPVDPPAGGLPRPPQRRRLTTTAPRRHTPRPASVQPLASIGRP